MSHAWRALVPRRLRDQLETNLLLRKIVGNTGWLLADRLLRLGLGLLVGVWVSRYLGPEQFGLYSYLLAVVALLAPLATLGLDTIVVRELLANPPAAHRVLGTAFTLRACGGALVVLLAVSAITLLHPGQSQQGLLIALIAAGSLVQALDVTDLWFQSQTLSRYSVIAKSAAFLASTLARVWLLLSQAPLLAFVWVALAEVALGTLGSALAFSRRAMPLRTWRVDLAQARGLLRSGWPMLLAGIAVMLYMKIDIVMLTQMRGEAATGVYAAALRISEVWYFIPMSLAASVTPAIIAARHESRELYHRRLERYFALMTRLALAFALPIALLAGPLVNLLFGPAYSEAGSVLAVHIWAAVFVFMGVAQNSWDVAEDLARLALYRTVGGALINVGLNLLLIPPLGPMGAAIATAVSYAFSAWLLNLIDPRSRPIFLLQTRALNPFAGLLPRLRRTPAPPGEQ